MSLIKCTNCNYEGKGKYRFAHWFIIIPLLLLGIAFVQFIMENQASAAAGPILLTVPLIIYGMKEFCPKCGFKNITKK